jgi:uncharacterized protein
MDRSIWNAVLIAAGIAFGGVYLGNAIQANAQNQRFIEVRGLAEKVVKADRAAWVLRYQASGEDMAGVMSEVGRQQQLILKFLTGRGFKAESIGTSSATVQDNWASGNRQAPQRYTVRSGVTLTSSDIAAVQRAETEVNELLKAGVVLDYPNLRYIFTGLNAIKPAMLTEATANAKQAAESFARDSNSRIVGLRSATQGLFSIGTPLGDHDEPGSVMKKVRVVTRMQYRIE